MSKATSARTVAHPIQCFHDGACPLCSREVAWLRRRDHDGRIEFIDISAPDFEASTWGRSQADLEGSLHVRLADGRFVDGVESFRQLYSAVGLGWLLAPTRWPVLRSLFDALYRGFARVRPLLPGRRREDGCSDRCVRVES
jgi:predicted DCC family thiol-disulfide oxidoreductase YuxK